MLVPRRDSLDEPKHPVSSRRTVKHMAGVLCTDRVCKATTTSAPRSDHDQGFLGCKTAPGAPVVVPTIWCMTKPPTTTPKPAKKVPPGGARNRPVRVATEATGGIALSVQEEAFAVAVAAGAGLTAALRSTHPEYSAWAPASQNSKASEVGARPNVVARITQLREAAGKAGNITVTELLELHLRRIRADPRELASRERCACRHCHGIDHKWQRNDEEVRRDRQRHEDRQDARALKDLAPLGEFDPEGGSGFDETAPPSPSCPHCSGRGVLRTVVRDLSTLSPEGLALLGGVKDGRDGPQVILADKDPSLNAVGRHVGFYATDNAQQHAEVDYAALAQQTILDLQEIHDRQAALVEDRKRLRDGA